MPTLMNIFSFMCFNLKCRYDTAIATVLKFGIFCPPGSENAKDPTIPASRPHPGAKGTGCDSLAGIVGSLAFSEPGGQKMPNMSTVASVVSYQSSETIDIMENMFINVGPYKFV